MTDDVTAGTARIAELSFDASATTAASLELNGTPCVRAITVRASERISGTRLRIIIDGVAATPYEQGVEPVGAGESLAVDVSDFMIPLAVLRKSTEREPVDIAALLIDAGGREIASARHRIMIAPATHWFGVNEACESLASFVTPNAPALVKMFHAASRKLADRTDNGALDGYQSNDATRAQRIAEACYEALAEQGFIYITTKPSFEDAGQKVRTAGDCEADRAGNCLDLSLALAALLEASGLAPAVALGDGHAIVGFATIDRRFPDPVHDGPSRLVNRIELGEFLAIEATGACDAKLSFAQALAEGERFLRKASSDIRVLDVCAARRAGYHPLPEPLRQGEVVSLDTRRPVKSGAWKAVEPARVRRLPDVELAPHERRLERWRNKLLDLTLRNRLLNDRANAGIPLLVAGDVGVAGLEDRLSDEMKKNLDLKARGSTRIADDAALADELKRGWLRADLEDAELFKRATKAFRDGRSSLEETGARSLHVAIGFLEFRDKGRDGAVRAPILLVPVDMDRISRSEGFRVVPVAEDAVANVALVEYMRIVHKLDIDLKCPMEEDERGVDVRELFARVREAVKNLPDARVVAAAKLGNYSFQKLPIYEEMRTRGAQLAEHPVVRSLLDRAAARPLRDARLVSSAEVEAAAPLEGLRLPLPADSSQIAAIASATSGATFVLQGPPGTGKSQTITNLLSECLQRGKRVLFIAEKAAALSVVSDRLRELGLSAFALNLHGEHASKPNFVAQMKRSLEELDARAAPGSRQFQAVATSLERARARLGASCGALHDARGEGFTAHKAVQRAVELAPRVQRAVELAPRVQKDVLREIGLKLEGSLPPRPSDAEVAARVNAITELARNVESLPAGAADALAGFTPVRLISHEEARALGQDARDAARLARSAGEAGARVAALVGVATPRTMGALAHLVAVGRALAIDCPGAAVLVKAALATNHEARLGEIRQGLAACEAAQNADVGLLGYDLPVLSLPLSEFVGDLRATRDKFWLFRWLAARKVRGQLVRVSQNAPPSGYDALLDECVRLQAIRETKEAAKPFAALLAPFRGVSGIDCARTAKAAEAALAASSAIRASFARDVTRAAMTAPQAAGKPALADATARLEALMSSLREALKRLEEALAPAPAFSGAEMDAAGTAERLDALAVREDDLAAWSACTVARLAAEKLALAPIAQALLSGLLGTTDAEKVAEGLLLAAWSRARLRDDGALADCACDRMDGIRHDFARGLREYCEGAVGAVATRVRDRASAALASADEAMRKARTTVDTLKPLTTMRRPIRRVMKDGATAISALKPIVLASPLSATTFLPPEFPPFDLVVFDEASQVPVWDAACAISRGHASVIVGDSKQLPPTRFFDRRDAEQDGDGGADDGSVLADLHEQLDSVLDEAIAAGIPQQSLLWHYRSRDERLIEFANRKSYGGRLQTFPAAHRQHPNLGVEFRFVEGGVYDRAKTATNRAEAHAVVEELVRRLRDDDACEANRWIGVVTFSVAQQALVQDLLDESVDKEPKLKERMDGARERGKEVFVRNLESVQGHQAATILVSVCYGRDASGAVYHNFGPLNLSGGERRLNVAVTRAREKIVVFSSLRASDLDAEKCRTGGAQDLLHYLEFAERGTVPPSRDEGIAPREVQVSPVEHAIAEALRTRGWNVDLHVGRSRDYRVSLAVADKEEPDRWRLGIVLDGVFHAAAPTVIDREAVRDGVLEGLGWHVVKVSCIDWLRSPDKALERIERALRSRRGSPAGGGRMRD